MRCRLATALALVGWYLMMPPVERDSRGTFADNAATLSKWHVMQAFDSAQACEEYRAKFWYGITDPAKKHVFFDTAQCIASDDPRLKGK